MRKKLLENAASLFEALERGEVVDDAAAPLAPLSQNTAKHLKRFHRLSRFPKAQTKILKKILKSVGENVRIEKGFDVSFGQNLSLGDNFYANVEFRVMDTVSVDIGKNVWIGPRCGIYCADHCLDAQERADFGVYGKKVVIEDNVWLGAHVVIVGGVRIGEGSVIGAGSVVSKDIPKGVIAAGNPCKVIRQITQADKKGYKREKAD